MTCHFTVTQAHPNGQQSATLNRTGVSQVANSALERPSLVADPHNPLSRLDSATARGLEAVLRGVSANVRSRPRFCNDQLVYFIGGIGTVKSCQINSGTWTYAVEMALGPEPEMGRIGSETTLLLHEGDIQGVIIDDCPR